MPHWIKTPVGAAVFLVAFSFPGTAQWLEHPTPGTPRTAQWATELSSPNLVMHHGWRSDSLKPGDEVVITGHRARDGSLLANARTVRLAGGERIFNAGSSGEEQ